VSIIVEMCDALAEGIQNNVEGLGPEFIPADRLHRYQPFDPEQLQADGQRHLAVYPVIERFDELITDESATGTHALSEHYAVLVWEGSGTEGTRLVRDEEGWKALLEVHESTLQWLYQSVTQIIGVSYFNWYAGTEFPTQASSTRWFRIILRTKQLRSFT
jgi:hypothetical protein